MAEKASTKKSSKRKGRSAPRGVTLLVDSSPPLREEETRDLYVEVDRLLWQTFADLINDREPLALEYVNKIVSEFCLGRDRQRLVFSTLPAKLRAAKRTGTSPKRWSTKRMQAVNVVGCWQLITLSSSLTPVTVKDLGQLYICRDFYLDFLDFIIARLGHWPKAASNCKRLCRGEHIPQQQFDDKLSADRRWELSVRLLDTKQRCLDSLNRITRGYARLVLAQTPRLRGSQDFDDTFNNAAIGLIKAVRRYTPDEASALGNYAKFAMKTETALAQHLNSNIRIPVGTWYTISKMDREANKTGTALTKYSQEQIDKATEIRALWTTKSFEELLRADPDYDVAQENGSVPVDQMLVPPNPAWSSEDRRAVVTMLLNRGADAASVLNWLNQVTYADVR